jgi:hypothetical protein
MTTITNITASSLSLPRTTGYYVDVASGQTAVLPENIAESGIVWALERGLITSEDFVPTPADTTPATAEVAPAAATVVDAPVEAPAEATEAPSKRRKAQAATEVPAEPQTPPEALVAAEPTPALAVETPAV